MAIDACLDLHSQIVAGAATDHAYAADGSHGLKRRYSLNGELGAHRYALQYAAEHEARRAVSANADERRAGIGIGVRLIAASEMWKEELSNSIAQSSLAARRSFGAPLLRQRQWVVPLHS